MPQRVLVQVTIKRIEHVDTAKKCFTADIIIRARWRVPNIGLLGKQALPLDFLSFLLLISNFNFKKLMWMNLNGEGEWPSGISGFL